MNQNNFVVTFLDALDSMGILNIHAKELFEIQKLVVHLNNFRPHSTNKPEGGLRGEQSGTFCNHASRTPRFDQI